MVNVTILSSIYVIDIRIVSNLFLLLTTNKWNCDWRGRIFRFLNKSHHESLLFQLVTIMIIFFCILKIFLLCEEFWFHSVSFSNHKVVYSLLIRFSSQCFLWSLSWTLGYAVVQLVEALCYKLEGVIWFPMGSWGIFI